MSGRSSCPECGTPLRIRDRSLIGRSVNCPECKTELRVDAPDNDDGPLIIRRPTAAELAARTKKHGERPALSHASSRPNPSKSQFRRTIESPLTALWLVVIAVGTLFAVLALNPKVKLSFGRSTILPSESKSISNPIPTPTPNESPVSATPEVAVEIDPSLQSEERQPMPQVADDHFISALEPVNVEQPLEFTPEPVSSQAEATTALLPKMSRKDIEAKLAQKIVLYKQPNVSRRVLIDALSEQLGVPIRFDTIELGSAKLDDKITFELANTTLGAIVEEVAKLSNWQVAIEDDGIMLSKSP